MNIEIIVYITASAVMLLGLIGIVIERIITGRGFGARAIQFTAVCLILPILLLLAYSGKLQQETVATLLGALTGYLLSGVGDYESKGKRERNENKKEKSPDIEAEP